MTDELPKQELLTKLLKMTTSSNDGEALTAMRKANALLLTAGWDWDRLIAGKIVVVGDPFGAISTPQPTTNRSGRAPAPPPRLTPAAPTWHARASTPSTASMPPGAATTPNPPRRPPPASADYSTRKNIYPGGCYCCGITVDIDDGFVFKPSQHNRSITKNIDKGYPICKSCNKMSFVPPSPAKRVFPPIHPTDLHSL